MIRRCCIVAAGLLLLAISAQAEGQGGTRSPFAFGLGSRDLAMGGATVARCEASTAPFWNPSQLVRAERYSLSGFHSSLYESDMAYQYLGLVVPTLDFGTIGLGVARLGIGGIERRTVNNDLVGEFDDSRLGVYLGYARRVSGYDLGFALTLEHHSLDTYNATSSPGLNLSVTKSVQPSADWLRTVSFSLVGRNVIKPGLKLFEETVKYPLAFQCGIALDLHPTADDNHALVLTGGVEQVEDLDPTVKAGLEYSLYRTLELRCGVRSGQPSFGAGLYFRGFAFDYALVDRDLGSMHMFTLTTEFGSSVSERRSRRQQERQEEFNSLMEDRLVASNRETIGKLTAEGRTLLSDEQFADAENRFDRALFLARNGGLDTTEVAQLAAEAHRLLVQRERYNRIESNLKAAESGLRSREFLQARHYASLVLQDDSTVSRANSIIAVADSALAASEALDDLIQERLWVIDSLLSYGRTEEARKVAGTLQEYAGDNMSVQVAVKRVEFETWREAVSEAYLLRDYSRAMQALDSALARFPAHQWCLEMRTRVQQDMAALAQASQAKPEPRPTGKVLSDEVRKQVEDIDRQARAAFERGDLDEAINDWERVLNLDPRHSSAQTYLVNAYKFVGVDLYGQNKLREAVEVWRKAARIAPGNTEIQQYISRTENEIARLNELSYEQ